MPGGGVGFCGWLGVLTGAATGGWGVNPVPGGMLVGLLVPD